jgi:hypothetical protein
MGCASSTSVKENVSDTQKCPDLKSIEQDINLIIQTYFKDLDKTNLDEILKSINDIDKIKFLNSINNIFLKILENKDNKTPSSLLTKITDESLSDLLGTNNYIFESIVKHIIKYITYQKKDYESLIKEYTLKINDKQEELEKFIIFYNIFNPYSKAKQYELILEDVDDDVNDDKQKALEKIALIEYNIIFKLPEKQTGGNTNKHKEDIKHLRKLLKNKKLTDKQKQQYLKKIDSIKSKIQKQTGGNTNQHKEDIKHLRKLLKNKKLTDKQKQQYLKKIESIKVKIEKQNKTDKINKCKEHIINLRKTLKNKNITESQKQQCHHKISNYKLKIKELK